MSEQAWTAVGTMTAINVLLCVGLVVAFAMLLKGQLEKTLKAVNKRLDASEIYLTAAEQHTAHQVGLEGRIGQQLRDSEQVVVRKVEQVPHETASLVAKEAVKVAERLGTGDSHHP